MALPTYLEFLNYQIYNNFLWQFLLFAGIIILTVIIGKILNYIIKGAVHSFTKKTETEFDDLIVEALSPPVIYFIALIGYYLGYHRLTLSESAYNFFNGATEVLVIIGVAWLIIRFFDGVVSHYLVPLTSRTKSDLDDHLVPIIKKLIKVVIVIIAGLMVLDKFGYNITSILAGLGLGGLAFALAAKDILANLFGGVAVFTDKPFKIGDRIKINGYDGIVKTIDVRSTKIKTLEGRMVTIPNLKFSDSFIENVTKEPTRKINFSLGLTYDTPPAKLEKAIQIVKDILKKTKFVDINDASIYFDEFGDFSLNLKIIYFIDAKGDWKTIYSTKDKVNNEILKKFNQAKLNFAFPTQTIELLKNK